MNIVVLAGGNSTEREVSLVSGKGVYEALKSKGHNVVLLDVYLGIEDVDVDNIFDDKRNWADGINAVKEVNPDVSAIKKLKGDNKDFFGKNVREICMKADIVFLALHGANGEDGKIQAALDLMEVKYTGTDYLSSAICMDKALTKEFFRMNNVLTPAAVNILPGEEYMDKVKAFGYPMVVKAPNGGSSVGVFIVNNEEELKDAVDKCFKLDNHVLIEQFVKGREFTCGVVNGHALPIVEIEPVKGFYDYKNKYQAGSTIETCPAKVSEEITTKIQRSAEEAFKALRLNTYARIDFIVDDKEDAYCLEANTLPGMTPTSLLPQEANVVGIDYPSLCEQIIEISMAKYN